MYVKHLGADMLLHRARKVIGRLESAEQEYLASGAVRVERAADGAGPALVRIAAPPTPEVSLLAHEAVRSSRAALDALAVSLVVASRRAPRSTTFPIGADAHAYLDEEHQCLRHANQEARRAVRSVTPWRGADDRLWELRLLDRPDGFAVGLGQVVEVGPTRVPSVLGVLQPGAQTSKACLPLSDGSPLAPGRGTGDSGLQLVMTYGEPARTRPLVATLTLLTAHVEDVIERVVSAAEH